MTTTIERLRAILVRDYKLAPEVLTPEAPLEALGLDSLGVAELLFNVEDEFRIRLPQEPVHLPTLGDVVGFIDALVAAQSMGGAPPGGAAAAPAGTPPGGAPAAPAAAPATPPPAP